MKITFGFIPLALLSYAAAQECRDKTTCVECINHGTFCGWCSPSPTVYNNGTIGTRCQDQRDQSGWHCSGVYSTDKCLQGYICDGSTGTCKQAPAGKGNSLENCNKTCHKSPPAPPAPHTLSVCNATKKTCEPCQDYCKDNSDCKSGYCQNGLCHGSTCESNETCTSKCSADTPDEIVGVWRGIMINRGYQMGEFDFEFRKKGNDAPQVVFRPPAGPVSTGELIVDTATGGRDITVIYNSGPYKGVTYVGAYSPWEPSPFTESAAFYFGLPNKPGPTNIDAAMAGQGSTVFAMSRCKNHGTAKCNFTSAFPDSARGRYVIAKEDISPIHDPCNLFPNCSSCTEAASGLCGWCSQPVTYKNKSTGAKCAGFDSTGKPLGWVCHGLFYKGACPDYGCDYTDIKNPQCKQCDGPTCIHTKEDCSQTCKPPPQLFKCDPSNNTCVPCKSAYCTKDSDCPGSYCQIHGPGPWTCHGGSSCVTNSSCSDSCKSHNNASSFKCEPFSGQCKAANKTTPGATTKYECNHECTSAAPKGTWRGIQVSQDFTRGEWDFTFYENSTLRWRDAKGVTYAAKVIGFNETEGTDKTMSISGKIIETGATFFGLYKFDRKGDDNEIDMLFWGQGEKPLSSFDDAMSASLLILNGCRKGTSAYCDFSSSIVGMESEIKIAVAEAKIYEGYDEM